jgi:hypothetical protein
LSLHPFDDRRLPRTVEDGFIRPVRTDVEGERAVRRGQPVAFLVLAGRFGACIESQGTVCVVLEGLVLGAQRVTFERVWVEEVVLVIQSKRPEAFDRRQLALGEGDRVAVPPIELPAIAVIVREDVLGLLRLVVVYARFGGGRTTEVWSPQHRQVRRTP